MGGNQSRSGKKCGSYSAENTPNLGDTRKNKRACSSQSGRRNELDIDLNCRGGRLEDLGADCDNFDGVQSCPVSARDNTGRGSQSGSPRMSPIRVPQTARIAGRFLRSKAAANSALANQRNVSVKEVHSTTEQQQQHSNNTNSTNNNNNNNGNPNCLEEPTIPQTAMSIPSPIRDLGMAGSQNLSIFQRRLLTQTWNQVHRGSCGDIGKLVFQRFLAKRPECRVMFQKASAVGVFNAPGQMGGGLSDHQRMLSDLLDRAVKNLDEHLDEIGAECVQMGVKHSHMATAPTCEGAHFTKDLWDVFGQMMLEAITQLDTVRKHRELVRAWTILGSFLVDKFRQGYEMGIRRPSLQNIKAEGEADTEGDESRT